MEKRRPPIDENKVEMPPVFPPIDTTALLAGRWNIPHLGVVLPHRSPGSGPGQALRRTIVRLIRGSSDAPTSSMAVMGDSGPPSSCRNYSYDNHGAHLDTSRLFE